MGLVHIFLFLNVKDGPSRYHVAGFYAVCVPSDRKTKASPSLGLNLGFPLCDPTGLA